MVRAARWMPGSSPGMTAQGWQAPERCGGTAEGGCGRRRGSQHCHPRACPGDPCHSLPQPHARPAAVLRNKHDPGGFQGIAQGIYRAGLHALTSLEPCHGSWSYLGSFGEVSDAPSKSSARHLTLKRRHGAVFDIRTQCPVPCRQAAHFRRRRPGPPPFSKINSMPAASRVDRMARRFSGTGDLAPRSKSATVDRPTPAASARSHCDRLSRARAARHCPGEIDMSFASDNLFDYSV